MLREASPSLQVHLDLLLRAYSHYDRRNVLPARGAWMDQTRSFLSGVDLIDAERGFWEGLRREHHDRESKRAEMQANVARRGGRR